MNQDYTRIRTYAKGEIEARKDGASTDGVYRHLDIYYSVCYYKCNKRKE